MMDHAVELITSRPERPQSVTVNAARGAIPAYERLGFIVVEPEQTKNGIIFTPMARELA